MARHEGALSGLFGQVLRLCDEAGLVRPGVVAIDGTRMAGNASRESTRDFEGIAREILAEAKATDEAEDELYGEERGDELPEQLHAGGPGGVLPPSTPAARGREARRSAARGAPEPARVRRRGSSSILSGSWRAARAARVGRGKRAASSSSAAGRTRSCSHARENRLLLAGERLEAERDAQVAANRAYEDYRRTVVTSKADGSVADRSRGSRPEVPEGVVSVTDPDTQRMKANHGMCRGITRRRWWMRSRS